MGWTVSVSWNAQNNSTDVEVSMAHPLPQAPSPPESERKLVPLDEWRRRVAPRENEQTTGERDDQQN